MKLERVILKQSLNSMVILRKMNFQRLFDNEDFGYWQITVERPLRDEGGNIVKDGKGKPKPDANLRDNERVPLKEDIKTYFEREVLPHVPDAWIDKSKTKKGYEINFTKYFYKYKPLRRLSEIRADILALEKETEGWKVQKLKNIAKVNLSHVDKKTNEDEDTVKLCNYVDVYYND